MVQATTHIYTKENRFYFAKYYYFWRSTRVSNDKEKFYKVHIGIRRTRLFRGTLLQISVIELVLRYTYKPVLWYTVHEFYTRGELISILQFSASIWIYLFLISLILNWLYYRYNLYSFNLIISTTQVYHYYGRFFLVFLLTIFFLSHDFTLFSELHWNEFGSSKVNWKSLTFFWKNIHINILEWTKGILKII